MKCVICVVSVSQYSSSIIGFLGREANRYFVSVWTALSSKRKDLFVLFWDGVFLQ
jgi:hypothetical protein